jgi:hypothetical protein
MCSRSSLVKVGLSSWSAGACIPALPGVSRPERLGIVPVARPSASYEDGVLQSGRTTRPRSSTGAFSTTRSGGNAAGVSFCGVSFPVQSGRSIFCSFDMFQPSAVVSGATICASTRARSLPAQSAPAW